MAAMVIAEESYEGKDDSKTGRNARKWCEGIDVIPLNVTKWAQFQPLGRIGAFGGVSGVPNDRIIFAAAVCGR
jgi:hypothetical protein